MQEKPHIATFGLERISHIDIQRLPPNLSSRVPYSFVRKNLALPIEEVADTIIVALADPLNIEPLDELKLLLDKKIRAVLAAENLILNAINVAYHHKENAASELLSNLENGSEKSVRDTSVEVYDLLAEQQSAPVVQLLNFILSEAISQRASDIHFEPFEQDLCIRYRIDGVLVKRHAPPHEYQAPLLSRIKVLAKLDIAEQRLPQDGRIKVSMGGKQIDLRVSTLPAIHGERIVLRLLDQENLRVGLSELGMTTSMLQAFRRTLACTEGIILVTGPTGSGKTTTLYSVLSEKRSDEINIMTIEDPIEYKLEGVAQVAVHPKIGLTFAQGLRHILRQDPDVVMVGEIRDGETAEIAIQASLTGHLVLSTLHTNDAPSAITRLVDMGVEPYLLSSTLVAVLAQRLTRKICPHCKESYEPSVAELKELKIEPFELQQGRLYRGRGCKCCMGSGFLGRVGIYELMVVGEPLQQQIAKNPDSCILRSVAQTQGLMPLIAQGTELVCQGVTTASEVLRVTRRIESRGQI